MPESDDFFFVCSIHFYLKCLKAITLLFQQYHVPGVSTRHQCTIFDLKWLGKKHHLIHVRSSVMIKHYQPYVHDKILKIKFMADLKLQNVHVQLALVKPLLNFIVKYSLGKYNWHIYYKLLGISTKYN